MTDGGSVETALGTVSRASGEVAAERAPACCRELTQQLEASKARFRALVQLNLDGIVVMNRQGDVRFANPAACALFGLDARHLEGRRLDLPFVAGNSGLVNIRRASGEAGKVEAGTIETEWDGEPSVLVILHDVTAQHLAEQELVRVQREAKRVNQMQSDFVDNVTHEIRTPLTSMRNALSNLLAGAAGRLKGEAREYVEMLDGDARRLCALVEELLDMSRLERGAEFERAPVGLRDVADEAVLPSVEAARAKSVTLSVQVPSRLVPVTGDRVAIGQVLTNLVANAVKFTPEHGRITIRAQERKEDVLVCVSDTGRGIGPEHRDRVFEKFYQVGREAKGGIQGTGLGLAICKGIVLRHGGKIWCESKEGKGSAFFVLLPKGPCKNNLTVWRGARPSDSRNED